MATDSYYVPMEGQRFHCACGETFARASELDAHNKAENAKLSLKDRYLAHAWKGSDRVVAKGLPYYVGYGRAASACRITALMEPFGWKLYSYVVLPQPRQRHAHS